MKCRIKKSEEPVDTSFMDMLLQVVENQLSANEPPETRETLDRLVRLGYPERTSKMMIAAVAGEQFPTVMLKDEPFSKKKFIDGLAELPEKYDTQLSENKTENT